MSITNEGKSIIMYELIKEKIADNLSKQDVLKEGMIENQIEEWKKVVDINTPPFLLKTILGIEKEEDIRQLSDDEWRYLQKELEESFIVRIEKGILVKGEEQQKRDTTWWSMKKQIESDKYYSDNYKTYMKRSLPPEVIKTVDEDTDSIMDNLADPDSGGFSIYGMVVGHVQSGKTSNYASLLCKAADSGYRFIVVIAGGLNNLRNQTQQRLDEVFVGADYQGVGKLPGFKQEKMPLSLTNEKSDFKIETAKASGTTNFENMQLPILVVIKKHTKSLENLLNWLDKHYKNKIDKAMLVIDDESDYASINTKDEEDPTVINEKIRMLLGKFNKSAYVAYTATPYANIFIDDEAHNEDAGSDLFPRDFIYALDAPSNYFGAKKIFGKDKKFVVSIPDTDAVNELVGERVYPPGEMPFIIKHKKNYENELDRLPESLKDAIRLFVINIGIRNLRNQKKHNSMLIHISRFTDVHKKVKDLVEKYFQEVKDEILAYGNMPNASKLSHHIQQISKTFTLRLTEIEFTFEQILYEICQVVETILILDVHQRAKKKLEYRKDTRSNVIVIGGLSLSRGYTLEGLSVSYFLRTTIYYDTLMQMGRWFGYRIGYEDICRIYLTDDLYKKFSFIIEATNDLVDRLKEMKEENLTPKDFGLAVKAHPDSILQVTARNKAKYTDDMYLQMNLDGSIKETRWISNQSEDLEANEVLLRNTICSLQTSGYEHVEDRSHLWKNVDNKVVKEFVESYRLYKNDPLGLQSRMPIDFIKEYVNGQQPQWDIVLFNGSGTDDIFEEGSIKVSRQYRSVKRKPKYYEVSNRQLSRAKPERIVMMQGDKNLSSKEMRKKLVKPLLMLHVLVLGDENGQKCNAVGFGISFPSHEITKNRTLKVKINRVYKRQIEEAFKNEMDESSDMDD
ncbi:Z1 domain-containing protein [Cytobacillus kochii]